MDAIAYLEKLQRETKSKLDPQPFHTSHVQSHLRSWIEMNPEADADEVKRELEAIEKGNEFRLDEPFTLAIIESLREKTKAALKDLTGQEIPFPVVGSLPVGEVNAFAVKVPESDESIIVLHSGIIGFLYLVCKSVAAFFRERKASDNDWISFALDRETLLTCVDSDQVSRDRFQEIFEMYLVYGNPFRAKPYILGQPHSTLAALFCDSAELFVFCHEAGHILAGHTDNCVLRKLHGVEVSVRSETWDMEFEADLLGLDLMLRAMREQRIAVSLSYIGVEVFFSAIDTLNRCRGILDYGDEHVFTKPSQSHPSIADRRQAVRDGLQQIVGAKLANASLAVGANVTEAMEHLYSRIKGRFVELNAAGVSAASMWK